MKLPLLTGAYQARSIIASAQRCVNCFPEQNQADAEYPTTHYPTSGLVKLATAPESGFRGLYPATDGTLFAVASNTLYTIDPNGWTFTAVGTISSTDGPVSMVDNSITLVLVDGSARGVPSRP
jgi:hypothetical protein